MDSKIQFRVSDEEKELIKKKAKLAGMKLSEYCRFTSLGNVEIKLTTEIKEI